MIALATLGQHFFFENIAPMKYEITPTYTYEGKLFQRVKSKINIANERPAE